MYSISLCTKCNKIYVLCKLPRLVDEKIRRLGLIQIFAKNKNNNNLLALRINFI